MLKGSIVALVTPFKENGDVDYEELGRLLDYHCENKTDGIVILGTTGEASCLSFDEEAKVVEYSVKKVNKKVLWVPKLKSRIIFEKICQKDEKYF